MALRGRGLLAIWNGIARGRDDEFVEWHVREHIPERVALAGFISGRRYTAIDGAPRYFNFYEVDSPDVLRSPAYRARLDDPTPWTQRVVCDFTDTARTICRVAATGGRGMGGLAEVIRFAAMPDEAAALALVEALLQVPGVVAAHAALSDGDSAPPTAELRLRGRADDEWPAVLIVEAAARDAAASLRDGALGADALAGAGWPAPQGRGLYGLDFALHRDNLGGDGATEVRGER